MRFGLIDDFFADPKGMLIFLLLALPGRMLAISAHEAAHGWVADRCGDPTARLMGRVTLNPLKHLDPIGILCMLLLGIGWAKPVPVNPLNYRNYRRDDLKVSLAGVTVNLCLFLVGCLLVYGMIGAALAQVPDAAHYDPSIPLVRTVYGGETVIMDAEYYLPLSTGLMYPTSMTDMLIEPLWGQTASYLFQMLYYFMFTNLTLAVFNLIPVPPLDGYHVLNDLVLRRPLFADFRAQRAGQAIMYLLMFTGVLTEVLTWVDDRVFSGVSAVVSVIFRAVGLM